MNLRHSPQLVEILRTTLANLESDTSVDAADEDISQLRRTLVRWIAEAEASEVQQVGVPLSAAETPSAAGLPAAKKKALDLAVALISTPPATEPAENKDVPPAKDPAAA